MSKEHYTGILNDRQIRILSELPTSFIWWNDIDVGATVVQFKHPSEEYLSKCIRNPVKVPEEMVEYVRSSGKSFTRQQVSDFPEILKLFKPMVSPFFGESIKKNDKEEGVLSYGLSSYGYDVRVARRFKIFTNVNSSIVDPKQPDDRNYIDYEGDVCIIPPNSFVLAYSMEHFNIPRNVDVIVVGKSTIARTGVNCICTPLEAEWSGHVTLEFSNTTSLPVKLYAEEGSCQVKFFMGEQPETSYEDRKGKYQNQPSDIVLAKI